MGKEKREKRQFCQKPSVSSRNTPDDANFDIPVHIKEVSSLYFFLFFILDRSFFFPLYRNKDWSMKRGEEEKKSFPFCSYNSK